MIWRLITTGTWSSNPDGSEALHVFDVQDFGLAVSEVVFAIELAARSSTGARVRLHHDYGASANAAGFVTTAPDSIVATQLNGALPATLIGTTSMTTPFFRISLGVSSAEGQAESVTLNVYSGGRLH